MTDLKTDTLELAVLFGKPVLFTDDRIDRDLLPDGVYAYDIRHTDDDFVPATLEDHVMVNFYGTIISDKPFVIPEGSHLPLNENDLRIDEYATATLDEYIRGDFELTPEPEKEIRILVIEPLKQPYEMTVPNSLEAHQMLVGGYIEATFPFKDNATLICNEEGKLIGLPLNRKVGNDIIAGTFFLCGTDNRSGNFTSLSSEQVEQYKKEFSTIELYVNVKPVRPKPREEMAR